MYLNIIVLVLILFLIFLLSTYYYKQDTFINYQVNEKTYLVLDDKTQQENAANILYKVDNNLLLLINHINNKYSNLDNSNMNVRKKPIMNQIITRLNNSYKSNSLRENFPKEVGKDVSYNVNKGDDISLCLRNYANPDEFHEFNDIMFVAIHELAHSCNKSYGHDPSFWYIFRILLENAVDINIFSNIDYNSNKVDYCSMNITYNPIYDDQLDDHNYLG